MPIAVIAPRAIARILSPSVGQHRCAGRRADRIPGEILIAEPLSGSALIVDLAPYAYRHRKSDRSAERGSVIHARSLQRAIGDALDEHRHEEVLDLVGAEPAVVNRNGLRVDEIYSEAKPIERIHSTRVSGAGFRLS